MMRPSSPTTRRSFLGLAAVGALGLVVAGCGGDDASDEAPATSAAPATTEPTPTTVTADADTVVVRMQDVQFAPKVATVRLGQRVVWTNEDEMQHDVRALRGGRFQSELFGRGGDYAFTPKKAGTIEYDCSIHPGMTGTLKVVA